MIGSISLAFAFNFILKLTIVYSHFFYIPTILGCFWWRYKGIIIPVLLSCLIIILPQQLFSTDNLLRAFVLIGVGIVVSLLSDRIYKAESNLKGRVKELNCLYKINKAINNPNSSVDEILGGILDKIRCGWLYPELACVKIVFNGNEYKTKNFKPTPWRISREVLVHNKHLVIDMHYLENVPFRKEEIELLEEITDQLRVIFELKLTWIK